MPIASGIEWQTRKKLDSEAAKTEWRMRLYDIQARVPYQAALSELYGNKAMCQARGIDWDIKLGQHERECADVVFVTMRDENGADSGPVFDKVSYVGDAEINARHILFREEQPGVDDDDVVIELQRHHVLADFAQAAEGYDL